MKHCSSPLRKICRSRLGFTLVELVLVIALLAIVAAVAVPSFSNLRKKTTEDEILGYLSLVATQAQTIVTTYNRALADGTTPRFAGYNISSARSMQECLRAANNHAGVYDVVVTTVVPTDEDAIYYNYIDTIVVCIQFFDKENKPIERIAGSETVPCSPELQIQPDIKQVHHCRFVKAKYYHIDDGTPPSKPEWEIVP